MNDLSWLAPTIAALSAMAVAIISAMRSKDNGRKIETVLEKAVEIHSTTNGTLHAAEEATAAANSLKDVLAEKVESLARELEALKLSSSLAASAAAQSATDVREAQAVMPPAHEGLAG